MRMMTAKWWLLIRTWAILPAHLSHVGPCINDGHCRVHLIAWGNCPGTEELYMNSQTYGMCCWSLCSDMFGYIIVAIKRTAVWTGSNSFLGFACPWLHFLIKIPVYPCVFLRKSALALIKLRGEGGVRGSLIPLLWVVIHLLLIRPQISLNWMLSFSLGKNDKMMIPLWSC